MAQKILHIRTVGDYARYIGAPDLHPLVSVIHYDELTSMRHSLNSYEVYAMFLNDGILPELTYGTVHYNMPQHTLMCVAPGQIGGKTDTGEIVKAKGWALLFDSELLHRTFLGSQMPRYRFFSYNTSEPLLMTNDEWNTIVSCLEQLRAEISVKKDDQHQLPVIASWLSRTIDVQQDQKVNQHRSLRYCAPPDVCRYSSAVSEHAACARFAVGVFGHAAVCAYYCAPYPQRRAGART